jgi:hypothetical protein
MKFNERSNGRCKNIDDIWDKIKMKSLFTELEGKKIN